MPPEDAAANVSPDSGPDTIDAFIARWQQADGSELANYQLFVTELTALLRLPPPNPAQADQAQNAYVFERRVTFHQPDGSQSIGRIDCYRRSCFVLESKQSGLRMQSTAWDAAMLKAHAQGSSYARALPPEEGRPPFLLVTDVGRHIGVYVDFTRSGANYIPYPDALSHRIYLQDLRRPEIRERLRAIWLDPLSLDPARRSARVTRAISAKLAGLAKSLETAGAPSPPRPDAQEDPTPETPRPQPARGTDPEQVAGFLMRCLFTMFAEDVGLLPERAFSQLLADMRDDPDHLPHLLRQLWADMNAGSAFSGVLRAPIPHFNGGLFAEPEALPLTRAQIDGLIDAARADWKEVEPAIFGTLLERALDPVERHKLGAHYTPRAYVERLVLPTVIEPLRAEWANVQASAYRLDQDGKRAQAIEQVRAFHRRLCTLRVLDPACGSGNFLYVTLEHLKRLEGEVLEAQADLGFTQQGLELEGATVSPEQMLGLETNPRAARIAETVLWIGYLQWHFRTYAKTPPREPLLKDAHNIQCRDAVLAWDDIAFETDAQGRPVTRWDGRTTKPHPVTGEPVPDEGARVAVERYINPRPAAWPEADFVVGNPPFIGASTMRRALGDGYVEALRGAYLQVPESADYVMHWWHKAAGLARTGHIQRFGLITTNSLRQTFNRRVIAHHMEQKQPLSLAFAIPDHPWVDSADGAQVRIAMTVGQPGSEPGELRTVVAERSVGGEGLDVTLDKRLAMIFSDLSVGADVTSTVPLAANSSLCFRGVQPIGMGFVINDAEAKDLGLGRVKGLQKYIRRYRNGKDLTHSPRNVLIIDLFGLDIGTVRSEFPEVYQWILHRVKPARDQNTRKSYRQNWWTFGEPVVETRRSLKGLKRYIATVMTARHRFFQFLESDVLPDQKIVTVALEDAFSLGIISSRTHCLWAMRTGGWLGVGNDSVYSKSRSFAPFPFPFPHSDTSVETYDSHTAQRNNGANQSLQRHDAPDGLDSQAGGADVAAARPLRETVPPADATGTPDRAVAASGRVDADFDVDFDADTDGLDSTAELARSHLSAEPSAAPEWSDAPRISYSVPRTASAIANLAEQIDTHRKRQQALHPDLTLTNVYNVPGAPAPHRPRAGRAAADAQGAQGPRPGPGVRARPAPRRAGRRRARRLRLGRPRPGPGGPPRWHHALAGQARRAGRGGRGPAHPPSRAEPRARRRRGPRTGRVAPARLPEPHRRRHRAGRRRDRRRRRGAGRRRQGPLAQDSARPVPGRARHARGPARPRRRRAHCPPVQARPHQAGRRAPGDLGSPRPGPAARARSLRRLSPGSAEFHSATPRTACYPVYKLGSPMAGSCPPWGRRAPLGDDARAVSRCGGGESCLGWGHLPSRGGFAE
ncbi:class I SAM-dependent DNA methyltransferase [Thiohalocapsa halophila]|uniref:class I SAM-dependent DNA methyltransferase n=1 Tax=Thiohalocapsa halophila TaxID=69359 RepID=UPI0019048F8B|nr:class I SAM-dependent DNA methyltransferase [Thiohalocapsa halophila]